MRIRIWEEITPNLNWSHLLRGFETLRPLWWKDGHPWPKGDGNDSKRKEVLGDGLKPVEVKSGGE